MTEQSTELALDAKHRARIRNEIADALGKIDAKNWITLADALIDGKVPHVEVKL